MKSTRNVAVLVGSLRKASFSRRVASALVGMALPELKLELIDIGHLPFYNQDDDGDSPPPAWTVFRQQIKAADAVLFVTPEYNRSVPAVLKNALDVASRPYGHNAWAGKPGAVVSVSPGPTGAFGANHHLRQSLVFLNVPTMQQPEAYLGRIAEQFDTEGRLTEAHTRELLKIFIDTFASWIDIPTVGTEIAAAVPHKASR